MGLLLLCLAPLACTETQEKKSPPPPSGPGITFSWPRNGQLDVPTRAPLVFKFSDAVDAAAARAGCPAFCVEGTEGAVTGEVSLVGTNTILFRVAGAWAEGATYTVKVGSALMPTATNFPSAPLVRFTTRRMHPLPGPATVVGFNDVALDGQAMPFLDVSTIRVLFSEPIDPGSVTPSTVRLMDGQGNAVVANLSAGGAHVVLDPVAALTAGQTYTLTIEGVRDLGGEGATLFTQTLKPVKGLAQGPAVQQSLSLAPGWSGAVVPSALSGWPVNASQTSSPLIGAATLGLLAGGLKADLGDPAALGGPIPMIIKRGQRLDLSPLGIRFGGVIEASYETKTLHFTVLNDAVGFLSRNPFRPAEQVPDDKSPVFVDITLDTALTADDPGGNALATQTLMGLRLLGLSSVDTDQLVVEQVSSLDLGTLGINVAPTTIALRLRTGATLSPPVVPAPALLAVSPPIGGTPVFPETPVELVFSAPVTTDSATITLTENGTAVPNDVHVDGSTVIVKPSRRLVDGATVKVAFDGLRTVAGDAVAGSSTDPLGGKNELTYTVAATPATTAPPIIASVTVGAPCAVGAASPTTGGICKGGLVGDSAYALFEQPANRDLAVTFAQPMRTSTFVLGTTCGTGAIRIERLDANGACQNPVPGTLTTHERGFRFVPAQPLVAGAKYRLVLVGGTDVTCDANELCGRGGLPLNTDPLNGQGATSAGGPDAVLTFTATEVSPDSLQPLLSEPLTDLNGNGEVDPGETMYEPNRAAMEVVDTTGIISSAKLNGADCLPGRPGQQSCTAMRTDLPVSVGAMLDHCPIDEAGMPTANGGPCLEIHVLPNLILGTSLSMDTKAIGLIPLNGLSTHGMILRMREVGSVAHGYIMRGPNDAYAQFVIHQLIYLDAPDLEILGGVVTHDLKSKSMEVVLKGPVSFFPDGRMKVALSNASDIPLTVSVKALALTGSIVLRIPQGEMHLTLVGPPLR